MFLEKDQVLKWVQDMDLRFVRASKGRYDFYINKHDFKIYLYPFEGSYGLINNIADDLEKAKEFCENYQLPNP